MTAVRIDFTGNDYLTGLELRWIDNKFRVRGEIPPGGEVVIVGIDDKTLAKLGSARTFTRDNWARMIEQLRVAQPKAVGFDITFNEPDVSSPDNDASFAAAIRESGNVVLGVYLDLEATTAERRTDQAVSPEMLQLIEAKQILPVERRPRGSSSQIDAIMRGANLQLNIDQLNAAALTFGFVNFHPDAEGRLTHQPQFIDYDGLLYPSLDLQLLRKYLDAPSIIVDIENGRFNQVMVGNLPIPTDRFGRFMLNFNGKRGTHQTVSMIDVIEGLVPPETFRDKIVLIGAPAVGLGDVVATPFDAVLPGVELHATVMDNILHQRYLIRHTPARLFDISFILLTGLFLGFYLPRFSATRSVVSAALLLIVFTAINIYSFISWSWILGFVLPGLSLVITSGTVISYKYLTEEREKKRTKAVFQFYLDQTVIDQVMGQPERLKLGGERVDATILFSDIRGFTSFSERMSPTELVTFMNAYFDKMTGLLRGTGATLDKLIGDAIMCFWGAPIPMHDHQLRGVITALKMGAAIRELRSSIKLPGADSLEIGVGLNSDEVSVGNMGSQNRFQYTAMGDGVNLASRLEGINKYYGTRIIISETTYAAVKDVIFCREIDTIQVKGRATALTIYEPLGVRPPKVDRRRAGDRRAPASIKTKAMQSFHLAMHGERRLRDRRQTTDAILVSKPAMEVATMYEHALALYRKGNFDEAQMAFDHVLSLSPNDGPSKLMKGRIEKYRHEYAGAGKRFDGIYRFEEK